MCHNLCHVDETVLRDKFIILKAYIFKQVKSELHIQFKKSGRKTNSLDKSMKDDK